MTRQVCLKYVPLPGCSHVGVEQPQLPGNRNQILLMFVFDKGVQQPWNKINTSVKRGGKTHSFRFPSCNVSLHVI